MEARNSFEKWLLGRIGRSGHIANFAAAWLNDSNRPKSPKCADIKAYLKASGASEYTVKGFGHAYKLFLVEKSKQ